MSHAGILLFPRLDPQHAESSTRRRDLGKIISFIGTPCEENWEGVSELPNFLPFKVCEGNMKTVMEGKVSNSGIELLKGMLTLDPKKRFSCEEILGHKFFEEDEGVATLEEVVKEMGLK